MITPIFYFPINDYIGGKLPKWPKSLIFSYLHGLFLRLAISFRVQSNANMLETASRHCAEFLGPLFFLMGFGPATSVGSLG